MTDFRALCAELLIALENAISIIYYEGGTKHISTAKPIVNRARAALADEPAVPEGREPVAVTGQPSDEDLLELAAAEMDNSPNWEEPEYSYEAGNPFPYEAPGVAWVNFARAVLARWGNPAPVPAADVSQLSDGYHTFAELYEHRYSLMLALMRALPRICWFSRRHADGELPFGSDDWFIVGAELPGAPITYHLPAALYSLAQKTGALELPAGRPWDGHSAADVVHRLRDWAIAPTPPADGEVAELEAWLREIGDTIQPSHLAEHQRYKRAAELLQRQALAPVPVPVSERLPGPEDCAPWPGEPNAGRWCWLASCVDNGWAWEQRTLGFLASFPQDFTHWLPAHALPIPQQQENAND